MKNQLAIAFLSTCICSMPVLAQQRQIYVCGPEPKYSGPAKTSNLKQKLEATDKTILEELGKNHISCSFSYSPEGKPINIQVENSSSKKELDKRVTHLIERDAPYKQVGKSLFSNWIITIKFLENGKVSMSTRPST